MCALEHIPLVSFLLKQKGNDKRSHLQISGGINSNMVYPTWYVSWHSLLHKDMPGHHIISGICFSSPPLCACVLQSLSNNKGRQRYRAMLFSKAAMCSLPFLQQFSAVLLAVCCPWDELHVVKRRKKKEAASCLCFVFAMLCVWGRKEQVGGPFEQRRPVWSEAEWCATSASRSSLIVWYAMNHLFTLNVVKFVKAVYLGWNLFVSFLFSNSHYVSPPPPNPPPHLLLFYEASNSNVL